MKYSHRYTMVDWNRTHNCYVLYCYDNDECVYTANFESTDEAHKIADAFLSRKLEILPV